MAQFHQVSFLTDVGSPEKRLGLPAKAFGLVAYLSETEQCVRRDLAALLWPSSSESSARHSLSQALYILRKSVVGPFLSVTPATVRLERLPSDTATLQAAIANRRWAIAADAYRGDFCEGLRIESRDFDDWVLGVRRAYRDLAKTVLEGLIRILDSARHYELASILSSQAPSVDSSGRLALGTLSHGSTQPTGEDVLWQPSFGGRFVGRDEEISYLQHKWRRCFRSARTEMITVVGEPGIGKTALLERSRKIMALEGAVSHGARGFAAEKNLPWGVTSQLILSIGLKHILKLESPWSSILLSAFPALREDSTGEDDVQMAVISELQIHEALIRLLDTAATVKPLALCIDDYHYCDPATHAFISALPRRLEGGSLFVLLASRPDAGVEQLDSATGALRLGPLPRKDVRELVTLAERADTDSIDVDEVIKRTGGNPLLVLALMSGQSSTGRDRDAEISLPDYMQFWLRDVSPDAITTLAATSLLPPPIDKDILREALGFDDGRFAQAAGELSARGLLVSGVNGIAPRHGLLADSAMSGLGPVAERTLRGRVARVLESAGTTSPALIATQFDVAGQHRRAYAAALRAADAAEAISAFSETAYFLSMALANASHRHARVDTALRLARLLAHDAKIDRARRVIAAIAEPANSESGAARLTACEILLDATELASNWDADLQWAKLVPLLPLLPAQELVSSCVAIAASALKTGWSDAADQALGTAREHLPQISDSEIGLNLRITITALDGYFSSSARALEELAQISHEAHRTPHLQLMAISSLGALQLVHGSVEKSIETLLSAVELVDRWGLYWDRFRILNNLGIALTESGRWTEAQEAFDRAASAAARHFDSGFEIQMAEDNILIMKWESEQYDEAYQIARKLLSGSRPRSQRSLWANTSILGLSALAIGRRAEAREAYREIIVTLPEPKAFTNDISHPEIFIARMDILDGKTERAVARLTRAIQAVSGRDFFCQARLQLELHGIIAAERPEEALDAIARLEDRLRNAGAAPLVERCERLRSRIERSLN